MSDDEKYLRDTIRTWVWGGFYDTARAAEHLEDLFTDDPELAVDKAAMEKALASEFATKAAAERTWPKETDCDRLDRVFDALNAQGICALQNAGYTQSDGFSDVSQIIHEQGRENFRGYCFFHGQDLERAVNGQGLLLAFGDLDQSDAKSLTVAHAIVDALAKERFTTAWDGTVKQRIDITNIDWKRRTPK
jgi:hypothetical protein